MRIVTNAGGLNPAGLAAAIGALADRLGLAARIGYVEGDALQRPDALTANAYLGAFGIAACLDGGADVVVTGRVTDASLVVGPAIARFGWGRDDLDALAGATVAGHLIECGAQVTGGNFSFFTELPDGGHRPGFPIAELHAGRLLGDHQASRAPAARSPWRRSPPNCSTRSAGRRTWGRTW